MTIPAQSPRASRAIVADCPGAPTTLSLYDSAGPLGTIQLGPAECVALASDLLLAARLRYGRPAKAPDKAAAEGVPP